MSYRLILKPSAEKQLDRLPKAVQRRVIGVLTQLEHNPHPARSIKLAGAERTYRVRVGDYRIVYDIDEPKQAVHVTIIAHRREVYRGL